MYSSPAHSTVTPYSACSDSGLKMNGHNQFRFHFVLAIKELCDKVWRMSRDKPEQYIQTIVDQLKQRVVDHLKAHGPQPWDTLVVELNQSRTGHIHTALKELQRWKTIKLRGWIVCLTEEVSNLQQDS